VLGGHVTNAQTGDALKKVTIRLIARNSAAGATGAFRGPGSAGQGYTTVSAADGSFQVEGIEPGQYMLSAQKGGFLPFNYGAKGPTQMGTLLTLSPGQQLSGLSLTLSPQALVSGKVVDSDGDPVEGGMVQALAQTWMRGKQRYMPRGGGQINDLGEFRVANLSPGKYYFCVQPFPGNRMGGPELTQSVDKPDIRPVRTCFPSATSLANATPIELKAGQDALGTNIQMQEVQTFHVRGKVVGTLPAGVNERGALNLSPREEAAMFFFNGQSNLKPDGSFDLAGVAPGPYVLHLFMAAGAFRLLGTQNVDVGSGDVNGVEIAVVAPGTLHGRVRIEGNVAGNAPVGLTTVPLTLFPAEMTGMMGQVPQAKAEADGAFSLENVLSGKYFVQTNAPQGTYLASVAYGSSDILGKELDLSGGVGGEVNVIFRYGAAEVSGSIKPPQENGSAPQSAPSGQILLVPDKLNADGSGVHFASTDTSGSFNVKQVPPGHYQAYALEQIETGEWQNPEFLKALESKATDVQVKENDKLQIQLPLISSEDLRQIVA
jgi:Carboxypeptidase regulatory-like domain